VRPLPPPPPAPPLQPGGAAKLERLNRLRRESTRAQSLGYVLNDSPLGLACWIAGKVSAWAENRRHHSSRTGRAALD
jgi:hypothetical protein